MTITFFFLVLAFFLGSLCARLFEWLIVAFVSYLRQKFAVNQVIARMKQEAHREGLLRKEELIED